jgi:hypothetical protein
MIISESGLDEGKAVWLKGLRRRESGTNEGERQMNNQELTVEQVQQYERDYTVVYNLFEEIQSTMDSRIAKSKKYVKVGTAALEILEIVCKYDPKSCDGTVALLDIAHQINSKKGFHDSVSPMDRARESFDIARENLDVKLSIDRNLALL